MSATQYNCPHCGASFNYDPDKPIQQFRCLKCGGVINVAEVFSPPPADESAEITSEPVLLEESGADSQQPNVPEPAPAVEEKTEVVPPTGYKCPRCKTGFNYVLSKLMQKIAQENNQTKRNKKMDNENAQEKSILVPLFDLSFTSFATTRIIKIVYEVSLCLLGIIAVVAFFFFGVSMLFDSGTMQMGILCTIATPFMLLFGIISVRMGLEFIIVVFRIAENTSKLVAHAETQEQSVSETHENLRPQP
jgi:DNA-directed RNA polymerase subunit RPC12/RpoP